MRRWGRNRRRADRERIAFLEQVAYGPYKPCIDPGIPSLDKMVITRKRTIIDDSPQRRCDITVELTLLCINSTMMDDLFKIFEKCSRVQLDGRVLIVREINSPQIYHSAGRMPKAQYPEFEVTLVQIVL